MLALVMAETRSDTARPHRCKEGSEAVLIHHQRTSFQPGVATEQISAAEGLALHAAAFNGMPDPALHLAAHAMGVVTGLAALEPDPPPAPT